DDDDATACWIARRAGQRPRNGIADDLVGAQLLLRAGSGAQGDGGRKRQGGGSSHPNTSPVMVLNQTSACAASALRVAGGASGALTIAPPSASVYWSSTGR